MLTLTTTSQIYIYNFVAVAVIALAPQTAKYSPFPRWFGYFTAFWTVSVEVAPLAFDFKSG